MTEKTSLRIELHYNEPEAALAWLESAFGFRTRMRVADDTGRLVFAEAAFGRQVIAVVPERPGLNLSPRAERNRDSDRPGADGRRVNAHCARRGPPGPRS